MHPTEDSLGFRIVAIACMLLLAALAGLLASCATPGLPGLPPAAATCHRFLEDMDGVVAAGGVADAGAARIEGFPHLRVSRFLASFVADRPQGEAYRYWLASLRRLDAEARQIELGNLAPDQQRALQALSPEAMPLGQAIAACGQRLAEADAAASQQRARLLQQVGVPDAYRGWQRAVGFYPLLRIAFAGAVARLHRELRQAFSLPLNELPVVGRLVRYGPPADAAMPQGQAAQILENAVRIPLGVPEPAPQELERLFESYAPVFEIDTRDDDDRIGTIRLGHRYQAKVDVAAPAVYRLASRTRFHQQSLLQLNYLVWFPARPAAGGFDIYAGRFDGLIWRVTLSADGTPLAYDSIHPCGCYYQVFPAAGFRIVQPEDGSEPILSPQAVGPLEPDLRLVIRLAHGTHFIQRVYADKPPDDAVGYRWRDYDELRSLPAPDGRRHSLFDPEGFVPGSARPERFLFWPMGVPSAGAMRQWGNHAIAFLGKRHFDDPRLLETLLRSLDSGPRQE